MGSQDLFPPLIKCFLLKTHFLKSLNGEYFSSVIFLSPALFCCLKALSHALQSGTRLSSFLMWAVTFTNWVIMRKLLDFSEPVCPHLFSSLINITTFIELLSCFKWVNPYGAIKTVPGLYSKHSVCVSYYLSWIDQVPTMNKAQSFSGDKVSNA